MRIAALAVILAASLALAQSTSSAPPPPDSEPPGTAGTTASATPPEKHRLGGGFRGLPVSAPGSPQTPAPKSTESAPRSSAKPKPVVINNETVGEGREGSRTAHGEGSAAGAPPPTPATAVDVRLPAITDLQGHDESYWRERARAAQDRVEKARGALVSTEAEEHRLENDFYAWDDGQYRDRVIKPEWDKAKQALVDAKAELIAADAALESLSDDARKAGALPGWLR